MPVIPVDAEARAQFHVRRGEWAEADAAFKEARRQRDAQVIGAVTRRDAIAESPEVAKTVGAAKNDVELSKLTDVAEVEALAEDRLAKSDFDAAIVAADEVVRREPKSWSGHALRGRALLGKGSLSAAIRALRSSTRKDAPGHVHNALGYALLLANEPTAALESFDVALEKGPVTHQLLNNLGLAYEKLARLEDAEAAFVGALELKADYVKAAVNLDRVTEARSALAELSDEIDDEPLPEELVRTEPAVAVVEDAMPEEAAKPEPELVPGG